MPKLTSIRTMQALNKSPKHRWSMLRNMASSVFIHQRIRTTHARAKLLYPLINRIFQNSFRKNKYHKLGGLLRNRLAMERLFGDYRMRFGSTTSSIVNISKLSNRRRGDNSVMARVELIQK